MTINLLKGRVGVRNVVVFLFCKCRRSLIQHLIAEIKVVVGYLVQDVTYCKNLLKKASEELYARAEAVYGRYSTHASDLYLGMS